MYEFYLSSKSHMQLARCFVVCVEVRASVVVVSVWLWASGGERSLICYQPNPAGPPHEVERQGVTTDDSDGCPEFCRQLGQLDALTTGTCFLPYKSIKR